MRLQKEVTMSAHLRIRKVSVRALVALALAAGAFFALTSNASAVTSDCPGGKICFWTGKTYGTAECRAGENCFSTFFGYEVGKHNLENIDPQSMYNHTGEHVAWFIEGLNIYSQGPNGDFSWGRRYTSYFEIQ
jgi:hypothetical protein